MIPNSTTDSIIAEIHQTRREISDRFNGDVAAIAEDAARRQAASGLPVWQRKDDEEFDVSEPQSAETAYRSRRAPKPHRLNWMAGINSSTVDTSIPTATRVHVSDETLSVELSDGRTISAPVAWYPRLSHGTSEERDHWRLIGDGRGIHWPDLDEDISVENLLAGQPSGESQASYQRWLDQRGKRGMGI